MAKEEFDTRVCGECGATFRASRLDAKTTCGLCRPNKSGLATMGNRRCSMCGAVTPRENLIITFGGEVCPECDARTQSKQPEAGGVKYDDGKLPVLVAPKNDLAERKPRLELLPTDMLNELARVLEYGATRKYSEESWREGGDYKKWIGAAIRHMNAWKDGEDIDPDSRCSHLSNVIFNAMCLYVWNLRGLGTDNRYKKHVPIVSQSLEDRGVPTREERAAARAAQEVAR